MRAAVVSADQGPEFAQLVARLAALRADRLGGAPPDRVLAREAGVSPTTVGEWLRGSRFPQRIDPLLKVVGKVRAQAEAARLDSEPEVAELLNVEQWRRAYRAEAAQRADGTRAGVEAVQGRAALEQVRPGWPLAEVTDPFLFHLEIHRTVGSSARGLPGLPTYVPRAHDGELAEVVAEAADGGSGIAVLVGGSCTGKTRSCWEALRVLRERPEPWCLWHPVTPSRGDAVLDELAYLAPYTVVWLNEAQEYLLADRGGEQVAAGLKSLMRDPGRHPVLVLATLWPEHWATLTARSQPDRYAQARELLEGHRIKVPDAFGDDALNNLPDSVHRDPLLREAVEYAGGGEITQYLAGGPQLLNRYQDAPPPARALIDAAMDARRLGASPYLSLAALAAAAPGYLTSLEKERAGDGWLGQAVDYATAPVNGIPGIFSPVPAPATGVCAASAGQGPWYRLADYLEQDGRRRRAEEIPPLSFWTAAAAHATTADMGALSLAAARRGLFRIAAHLRKHATAHGDAHTATALVELLSALHPGDTRPARYAASRVSPEDPLAVLELLRSMRKAGAHRRAVLLAKRAASCMPMGLPGIMAALLAEMREARAEVQAKELANRIVVEYPLSPASDVAAMLDDLREAGRRAQATALARRAARHCPLDSLDQMYIDMLLPALRAVGSGEQASVLADRVARDFPFRPDANSPIDLSRLLESMRQTGMHQQFTALAERAAADAPVDDSYSAMGFILRLLSAGAQEQAVVLAARAARRVPLDDPNGIADLLWAVQEVGATVEAVALADRAAESIPVHRPHLDRLLSSLRDMGAHGQAAALAERAAAGMPLNEPAEVARVLVGLRKTEAREAVSVLARRAAAHAPLNDLSALASLLDAMTFAGAEGQAAALALRITHVPPDDPDGVPRLLENLRAVGASKQISALAGQAAAHTVLDQPHHVLRLLTVLHAMEAEEPTAVLAERIATDLPLDSPRHVARLLDWLHKAGMQIQAATLAERAAVRTPLSHLSSVVALLDRLQTVGKQEQAARLAERAAHAPLAHPHDVARLLDWLHKAGMHAQATTLAERATQIPLGHHDGMDKLLGILRKIGTEEQTMTLAARLFRAGHPEHLYTSSTYRERFKYGQEPDGSASAPWAWQDLKLNCPEDPARARRLPRWPSAWRLSRKPQHQ
ncbi:hypothetical protein [Streptomyces mirabilis]|uniref:hypothetical protein n=1 Tax=Streptomyces mirabilis TaxID=68239 RepID=UPI003319BF60